MKQYRIAWQDKRTGYEGHGQWLELTFPETIHMSVRTLNQQLPDIDHWTEERDTTTTTRRDSGAATSEAQDVE